MNYKKNKRIRRLLVKIIIGIWFFSLGYFLSSIIFDIKNTPRTGIVPQNEKNIDIDIEIYNITIENEIHTKLNDIEVVKKEKEDTFESLIEEPVSIEYYNYLAEKYAKEYGADINWLKRVRHCESGDNHLNNRNPKCKGLYQFMIGTFLKYSKLAGIENANIWSAKDQTRTAAYMQSIGQQGQWTCK